MQNRRQFHVLGLALAGLVGLAASVGAKDQTAPGQLYVNKCAKCHRLYDPAKYPDQKWQVWMGKMSRKAKLTPEQAKSLSTYINEQFRSAGAPEKEPRHSQGTKR